MSEQKATVDEQIAEAKALKDAEAVAVAEAFCEVSHSIRLEALELLGRFVEWIGRLEKASFLSRQFSDAVRREIAWILVRGSTQRNGWMFNHRCELGMNLPNCQDKIARIDQAIYRAEIYRTMIQNGVCLSDEVFNAESAVNGIMGHFGTEKGWSDPAKVAADGPKSAAEEAKATSEEEAVFWEQMRRATEVNGPSDALIDEWGTVPT